MRILVAGVGNIFQGDDAFGVEVAARLAAQSLPREVRVVDFGIRGFDLAYALLDGHDATILVDAAARGGAPGTLYTIEIDAHAPPPGLEGPMDVEAHGMNPMRVLQMAQAMGGVAGRVLLVGCEPESLGPEEGSMGLSATVAAAIGPAVCMVEELVAEILEESRHAPGNGAAA